MKIIILTLILLSLSVPVMSANKCIQECKADVMDIQQCIEEEKSFWEAKDLPDWHFKIVCKDLIRQEKLNCYAECRKEKTP